MEGITTRVSVIDEAKTGLCVHPRLFDISMCVHACVLICLRPAKHTYMRVVGHVAEREKNIDPLMIHPEVVLTNPDYLCQCVFP